MCWSSFPIKPVAALLAQLKNRQGRQQETARAALAERTCSRAGRSTP